jgi:hypothetical protein
MAVHEQGVVLANKVRAEDPILQRLRVVHSQSNEALPVFVAIHILLAKKLEACMTEAEVESRELLCLGSCAHV